MATSTSPIRLVFVPAGAEYRTVRRAIKQIPTPPRIVSIPAGPQAFQTFLAAWEDRHLLRSATSVLMGLGGSLSPQYAVGDAILMERVWTDSANDATAVTSDRALTYEISKKLWLPIGDGVTCDRVITTAIEKRRLRDRYDAQVVDMESAILLQTVPGAKIAILRVISDDCQHDLPDIATAIAPDGSIRIGSLVGHFLKRPVAAVRLIRGSLKGLKTLERVAIALFE